MRHYLEHIKNTKEPHERRQHAMRVAGGVTLAVFALWLGTLGFRLAGPGAAPVAQSDGTQTTNADTSSLPAAAAAARQDNAAHLEVSTTSVYSN